MNAITPRPVGENVLRVLYDGVICDGRTLKITEQLDRYDYVAVNKVLEAVGGEWNRKAKAHLFPIDAADALDPVLLTGTITYPQDYGFFETPAPIVARLIEAAGIQLGMKVLEPSAGTGNIAVEALRCTPWVDCVELQPDKAATLRQRLAKQSPTAFCVVTTGDFLATTPGDLGTRYDRVVMNPPFARQADIQHVRHALTFLKPGGRLVAVMAAGVEFRLDRNAQFLRAVVGYSGGSIERLPERSFRESGTDVNTCLVTIHNTETA